MAIEPGGMLSHYRLVEKIGEGGMGVVWKAVDTTLDREVAVKILASDFAEDRDRLARFEREAKLLASLNQRNIAAIYGFEESDGVPFLVMELVKGEDLGERLKRGPLPVEESLDVAAQMARALEAAHDKGVVHRDLKPANVKVTHEGRVKVLDFGLAKALEVDSTSGDPSRSPTITSAGTRTGVILGTASYMSPEQARGRQLDKRTDIWSFGCVVYECLTGRQAFEGETISDTLASILKTEPDWSVLPGATPPRVRELLRRCLEKDVRNRLRDIGDARLELRAGSAADSDLTTAILPATGEARPAPSRRGTPLFLVAALLIGAVVGIAGWIGITGFGTSTTSELGVVRLDLRVPDGWVPSDPIVSPDGRTVVYKASWETSSDDHEPRLFVRTLADPEPRPVRGSEQAAGYTFSPDGRWLAFSAPVSAGSDERRLYKVPIDGSAPPLELAGMSSSWDPKVTLWTPGDELVIVGTESPQSVNRIPADGGPPRRPVEIETVGFEGRVQLGNPLPDERHVLLRSSVHEEEGWIMRVGLLDIETGEARLLLEDADDPHWSPTGHLLFSRHDSLLAVPFDPARLEVAGGPVAIADGLRTEEVWGGAGFDVSETGTLVHLPGGIVGANNLRISPDGRRIAVTITNPRALYEIWGSETDRPILRKLAAEPGMDCSFPAWSHDGSLLAYTMGGNSDREGIFLREVDGEGEPRLLVARESRAVFGFPVSFSPDGTWLVGQRSSVGKEDLWLGRVDSAGDNPPKPRLLIEDAMVGSISPDGRWISYTSDSSGRRELYIRAFRADGSVGRELPVTTTGADGGGWLKQKQPLKLVYFKDRRAHAVELRTDPTVAFSEPEYLAWVTELWPKALGGDALPDGRAMLIFKGEEEEDPHEIRVVLNWFEELEQRLAAGR
jgi:Tol biopolymer transport system component